MKLLSVGKVCFLCAFIFALISAWHPNSAPADNLNGVLGRSYVDCGYFISSTTGNGWNRTDYVWNKYDNEYPVYLTGITLLFLTPESLGYKDMETSNFTNATGAASVLYPAFSFCACWMVNYDTIDAGTFTNSGMTMQVDMILQPGEGFYLDTTSYSDIKGGSYRDVPEMVIGFLLQGEVLTPTPEPATLFLAGTGITLLVTRRRRKAQRK